MSDLIYRQMAIDAIEDHIKEYTSDRPEYNMARRHMKELIEVLPSAEPEPEIIACGDCKHYICHDRRCGYWNHGVKPLEWCCHGEERNG